MLEQYYQTLELSRSANKAEVRKAFRQLLKVWHPDRYANDPALRGRAEQKTKDLICAYEGVMLFLVNPEAYKKKYGHASTGSPEIRPHFDTDFMARHNEAYARRATEAAAARARRRQSLPGEILALSKMILKMPVIFGEMVLEVMFGSSIPVIIVILGLIIFFGTSQRVQVVTTRNVTRAYYELKQLHQSFRGVHRPDAP